MRGSKCCAITALCCTALRLFAFASTAATVALNSTPTPFDMHFGMCVKIQNFEDEDGRPVIKYKIHYQGWRARYDEWVAGDRIVGDHEEGKELQRSLKESAERNQKEQAARKKSAKARKATFDKKDDVVIPSGDTPILNGARKRPRLDSESAAADACETVFTVASLPPALRTQLVDDWNYVSQERRLVPLPAKKHMAINDILKSFVATVTKTSAADGKLAREVAAGVESTFNAAIGSVLLYPFERLQFSELISGHPGTPFSQLFGVEHLIRLLVILPQQLTLEKVAATSRLHKGFDLLIDFLSDRSGLYLVDEYEMAPPPYIRGNTQLGHGKPEA